jgi:hypothetical protein
MQLGHLGPGGKLEAIRIQKQRETTKTLSHQMCFVSRIREADIEKESEPDYPENSAQIFEKF